MLRYGVVAALASASAAPGAGLSATHVGARSVEAGPGGWVCGAEHRSELVGGRVVDAGAGGALAREIRAHFEGCELVRVGENAGRGGGLDVQYLLDADVAADAEFVAALELAAGVWEEQIADDVTIVIEVGFVSNAGYIGAASSNRFFVDYDVFRAAAVADAGGAESALVSALPDPVMAIEARFGLYESDDFDFDGIEVTTANARALGLPVDTSDPDFSDASIVFNTDFEFDNNPNDGLTEGSIDTLYVMAHEIGHMLGFISSVDGFTFGAYATTLDTFRVGIGGVSNDPADLGDFSSVAREGRRGVEAAVDPVNAVVGAPKGAVYRFSTGTSGSGDGRQASHWKDDDLLGIVPNIGVMDPTTSAPNGPGTGANPGYLTYADLLAFSVIGWDIDLDPAACAGDLNGDSSVGSDDLAVLLAAWGGGGPADFDASGTVGFGDLAILLATWGVCE